ncbi:MAG: ARMT1-like domain-containing protein [Anaerolineae bacterium]|nr:ARMT1-like domain-containing protein [Anaerolineae bacterium]
MRSKPDCLPCSVKQALSAARAAGVDERRQLEVVRAAVEAMRHFSLDFTPAYNSTLALWAAHQALGNDDPFAAQKRQYNDLALQMYPRLKALVASAGDRLEAAIKIAVAGNVIDLGILGSLSGHDVDIESTIAEVFAQGLAINDLPAFREALRRARRVLYLGDNAGEIVFDKVLVEEIAATGAAVVFAVKERPILNDATMEDALAVGMDGVARMVSSGAGEIGLPLRACSAALRQELAAADLIISKGQGNFESLDDVPAPVLFMLKAKCEVVAAALGVRLGEMGLLRSRAWADRWQG